MREEQSNDDRIEDEIFEKEIGPFLTPFPNNLG
jgi:hypothetical protein